ncbi:MAG: bifunctional (p)ppGpp synthetase/guanosine-3',5'-bis(diphosphate) 3'-pyrophosphohydrolase [Thermoproteota archaeon]|jgi:(p)ppGpp synthase/HD superfamily hydrolase|nr:bifunctional (p)ppGpp synthetase/guanosine-3',5'-bis(diphosphate) 3'-pyrophosphohydrolase [Candidatus Nitrosotenuis sp.]
MATVEEAEVYARAKNADIPFCRGVVFRLKSIGVTDESVLSSVFLCQTGSKFDEIYARFGREIAVLVASLTRDQGLTKQRQEEQYIKQLKDAPWDSTLIKLCEISAHLKLIKEAEISKSKRSKMLKQNIHYLLVLKNKIAENRSKTPGIEKLLDGINETLAHFGQREIKF